MKKPKTKENASGQRKRSLEVVRNRSEFVSLVDALVRFGFESKRRDTRIPALAA
jgi:hypothetical protein